MPVGSNTAQTARTPEKDPRGDGEGTEQPDDVVYSGDDEFDVTLSEADIERLASALSITATAIVEQEGVDGMRAVRDALYLRRDIKRQLREQKRGGAGMSEASAD